MRVLVTQVTCLRLSQGGHMPCSMVLAVLAFRPCHSRQLPCTLSSYVCQRFSHFERHWLQDLASERSNSGIDKTIFGWALFNHAIDILCCAAHGQPDLRQQRAGCCNARYSPAAAACGNTADCTQKAELTAEASCELASCWLLWSCLLMSPSMLHGDTPLCP